MTTTNQNLEQITFDDVWHFIIKLGLAAHTYGSTTAQL